MQVLRDQGWCIVLKALPPQIGWLIEGSRSEYDAPSKDQRVGQGKRCCEAQWCGGHEKYVASQVAFHEKPELAIQKINELCVEEIKRSNQ
jgi:hypothetical protein